MNKETKLTILTFANLISLGAMLVSWLYVFINVLSVCSGGGTGLTVHDIMAFAAFAGAIAVFELTWWLMKKIEMSSKGGSANGAVKPDVR